MINYFLFPVFPIIYNPIVSNELNIYKLGPQT
jgi:hypothetical protein